jgi:tRNA(adenine34) deaminase
MTSLIEPTYFMEQALKEARNAFDEDEVPIGAVVVLGNKIIGRGYNQTERLHDITAHAEMIAITAASNYLGSKYLENCTLYVTVEPCVMCAGAIKASRLEMVMIGAPEPKTGFSHLTQDVFLKNFPQTNYGMLEVECASLLQLFFSAKRKK